jgi:DHA1 family bicyclomycin/chloramphenicol resistance-like MFS transporter
MVALLLVAASRVDRLDVLVLLLFAGNGFLGLVIPATAVLAMEDYGEFAGTASALMGTLQFATGAICMIVAGIFFDGTPLPMIVGITICAVITFVIALVTLSRSRDLAAAPAE